MWIAISLFAYILTAYITTLCMHTHTKELFVVIILLVISVAVYLSLNTPDGDAPGLVGCTMDARVCPDGSAVGRVGPSCEFAPCPSAPLVEAGTATLTVGETGQVGGIHITFHGVKADYRCPSDVQCIQGGAIVADVTFADGKNTQRFNMPSDEAPRVYGVHRVSITDIQPQLISTEEADPKAYRVTFTVVPMTDEELVEEYLHKHIHDLSPEPEVLGGTFYVTRVTFGGEESAVVEYEDGHIALVADVTYTVSSSRDVTITNFTVRKDGGGGEVSIEIPRGASLDLSGQGLRNVSQDVFSRTNLVSLDLSNNTLTGSLPGEIRHLKALEWLDLSNNNFTGVPAEVGQLSELRYLDLSGNDLTGLPYELGNLKNLEVLNLTGNSYAKADLVIIKQGLPSAVRIIGE